MTALPLTLPELVIDIHGEPVPQGSMIPVTRGGRTFVVPDNATELRRWRAAATEAARARVIVTDWATLAGPVAVSIGFFLTRPKSVKRELPCVRPDLDKMIRALFDAMTDAAVWHDDGQVVRIHDVTKTYSTGQPGARIKIRSI